MILIIMYSVTNTYKIHFQLSARKACIFEGLKIITKKKKAIKSVNKITL